MSKSNWKRRRGAPRRVIYIAMEGRKTERIYFDALIVKHDFRHVRLVKRKPTHSSPGQVVKSLDLQRSKAKRTHGVDLAEEYWAVIDHDKHDIEAAVKQAKRSRIPIRIVDSKPCFEIWLALHHGALHQHRGLEGAALDGVCDKVVDYIKRHIDSGYDKTNYDAAKYVELFEDAIANAKASDKEATTPLLTLVGSRVYKLAESIIESAPNRRLN